MQEGGENFCKYSAIQQKGHSYFGAMANFKEICSAILPDPLPTQKSTGNRTFTLHKRLRYLAKGHSHFGAMAFCCALNERIPQAETKMRCDSASLLPVPTEKGAFAPFCWYG